MKKFKYFRYIMIVWIISLSSAFASDVFLVDSDGDEYHLGNFLGYEMENQKYYLQYYNQDASSPTSEGYLYYDELYGTIKIVVFENDDYYGFTMEGVWDGSGSTIYYVNNNGDTGAMGLYLQEYYSRARSKNVRVKRVKKVTDDQVE